MLRGAILCRTDNPERTGSVVHASVNVGGVAAVRTDIDAKSEGGARRRECCNDPVATAHVAQGADVLLELPHVRAGAAAPPCNREERRQSSGLVLAQLDAQQFLAAPKRAKSNSAARASPMPPIR